MTAGGLLLISICAAAPAQAQNPKLQDAKSMKCEFQLLATGTWEKDGTAQGQVKAGKLTVAYSAIDVQGGSATAQGAFGTLPIVVQASGRYLHFMQIDTSGYLYVTTVIDSPSRPGKFKGVHTRHEFTDIALPGYTSRPEQYYGECEPGF